MNLITQFKKSLGFYCAANQFVELSKRYFESQASDQLTNSEAFHALADSYKITLTSYEPTDTARTISLSYIVNIHLCFESFLTELGDHAKKYGVNAVSKPEKGETPLSYAERTVLVSSSKEITSRIKLCDYYREVRNTAVHDPKNEGRRVNAAFNKLKKYSYKTDAKYAKLEAPNPFDSITFDDFVMFARTCNELANCFYNDLQYSYEKIIDSMEMARIVKLCCYNNQQRGMNALAKYIESEFKCDPSLGANIEELYDRVLVRSSNRLRHPPL